MISWPIPMTCSGPQRHQFSEVLEPVSLLGLDDPPHQQLGQGERIWLSYFGPEHVGPRLPAAEVDVRQPRSAANLDGDLRVFRPDRIAFALEVGRRKHH